MFGFWHRCSSQGHGQGVQSHLGLGLECRLVPEGCWSQCVHRTIRQAGCQHSCHLMLQDLLLLKLSEMGLLSRAL